ncbi:MAG: phosphomannomutase/phosphoglucomutase [Pseudomonadota bacterium]
MSGAPRAHIAPNTPDFLTAPMIAPTGFREYDARWRFPDQINLPGVEALGLGLGHQVRESGRRDIVVGHDYRDYAGAVKTALVLGLVRAGLTVHDIGVALSPMAYFARLHLGVEAVAMVTASHNPNGWTGVKMGLAPPLTHGPEEMAALRDLVLGGRAGAAAGGRVIRQPGVAAAYLDDLASDGPLARPLKVVCACGNGTAGLFAPPLLERLGVEVVPLHTAPDYTFPHYNPNPEALEMLHDMGAAVRAAGADLALGFDGDGDRCGVVDGAGREIFADRLGVMLARDMARPGAHFVVDVKSTGLFTSDPELAARGATVEYWKTGHSHMKARVAATGAVAGFEKSGHFFLPPHGFDCGLRAGVAVLRMLDRAGRSLAALEADLPRAFNMPTLSPACPDRVKYAVMDRIAADLAGVAALGGSAVARIVTVNGARVELADGAWALVRASSNTPNLVVVCESLTSAAHLRAVFADLDAIIRRQPEVGAYDQTF